MICNHFDCTYCSGPGICTVTACSNIKYNGSGTCTITANVVPKSEYDQLLADYNNLKQRQPGFCAGCAIEPNDCIVDMNAQLEAENKELKQQLAPFDDAAKEYGIDAQAMLALAKSKIAAVKENIELQEQLEMKDIALNMALDRIRELTEPKYYDTRTLTICGLGKDDK